MRRDLPTGRQSSLKGDPPENRLSAETRAAIRAAYGRESASKVALRFGVKLNTVYGTWARARRAAERKNAKKRTENMPEPVPASVHPDRVTGLHGVSLPRLRCLEASA